MNAFDKIAECMRAASNATDPETKLAWQALARMWINLTNELAVLSETERTREELRLQDLENAVRPRVLH